MWGPDQVRAQPDSAAADMVAFVYKFEVRKVK